VNNQINEKLYLTEFRRLAGLRLTEAANPKLQAIKSLGEQTSGAKMVFGKLRKLKMGFQKAGDKSDRTSDKIDKVTDKTADLAAKRGGKFGKVGASLYHQTQAAKRFGQGLRNKALGQHGKAKKRFGQAKASLKTGVKTGFKAAASFK
jgi:hypothetical protein